MRFRYRFGTWLLAVALIVISGCVHTSDPKASVVQPSEKEITAQLFRRIEEQLDQPRYPFTLSIGHLRFEGEQEGEDWFLRNRNENRKKMEIRVNKKGETIFLRWGDQREKLNNRQFGILSPRDHLLLVKSAALRVQPLPHTKPSWQGAEVILSSEEMGDQLGKWMGKPFEQGPALQASRKFRIRYRFWYQSHQKGLSRLNIDILPQREEQPREKVRYHLGRP